MITDKLNNNAVAIILLKIKMLNKKHGAQMCTPCLFNFQSLNLRSLDIDLLLP